MSKIFKIPNNCVVWRNSDSKDFDGIGWTIADQIGLKIDGDEGYPDSVYYKRWLYSKSRWLPSRGRHVGGYAYENREARAIIKIYRTRADVPDSYTQE